MFKRIQCTINNKGSLWVVVEDCANNGRTIALRTYDNITWSTHRRLEYIASQLKIYPNLFTDSISIVIVGNSK